MASEKAKIVNTQQLSRRTPSVNSLRDMSKEDMRLPGEGKIKRAPGEVREGSFRAHSEVMDQIVGDTRDSADLTVTQEPSL